MTADSRGRPARPRRRLYVFTITVDWNRLEEELRSGGPICVLTPHWMFPGERTRVAEMGAKDCEFRTFHDLLDTTDMEYCDAEADRVVALEHGGRGGVGVDLVADYYTVLTRLKNQRAAERLVEEFRVAGGAVLCRDLGIVPEVWVSLGIEDRAPPKADVHTQWWWRRLRQRLANPVHFNFLDGKGDRWLLVGRPERVAQYLDRSEIDIRPLGRVRAFGLNMLLMALQWHSPRSRPGLVLWRMLLMPGRLGRRRLTQLAATVHEHSNALATLAGLLGLVYVNLQDSFLPGYYPSRYLLYRPQVKRFYVWDRFSQGIFRSHGLESARWCAYRSWTLPLIDKAGWKPIRRIVYLSSGAGDWTALKNRSDEDLALALLIEVARQRPDITIHYRPHPLWLHPEHQGLNSIERINACVEEIALPNLMVSQGVRADGHGFVRTGNLSAVSSSVDQDIAWADLVLGEHSQSVLVAAQRGKIIAGVNVSRHPPYFGDYARVGFPLLDSPGSLLALIDRMEGPSGGSEFIDGYNAAIRRHNRENCDETIGG